MKKVMLMALCLLAANFGYAQKAEWKAMQDFHAVMSPTFHPAEENNLNPTRENAQKLLLVAQNWQKSSVPVGFNAVLAKPILKKLVKDCSMVAQAVKAKKSDVELKKLITQAHDTFHEFAEKCRE
jgi:hypothetical protein